MKMQLSFHFDFWFAEIDRPTSNGLKKIFDLRQIRHGEVFFSHPNWEAPRQDQNRRRRRRADLLSRDVHQPSPGEARGSLPRPGGTGLLGAGAGWSRMKGGYGWILEWSITFWWPNHPNPTKKQIRKIKISSQFLFYFYFSPVSGEALSVNHLSTAVAPCQAMGKSQVRAPSAWCGKCSVDRPRRWGSWRLWTNRSAVRRQTSQGCANLWLFI